MIRTIEARPLGKRPPPGRLLDLTDTEDLRILMIGSPSSGIFDLAASIATITVGLCRVLIASSLEGAAAELRSGIDCILIDEALAAADLGAIQSVGAFAEIPRIFILSEGHEQEFFDAMGGATGEFITKGEVAPELAVQSILRAVRGVDLLRRLRDSESSFRRVFESSPDAILISSFEDGTILRANRAAGELLHTDSKTLRGSTLFDIGVGNPFEFDDASEIGIGVTRRSEGTVGRGADQVVGATASTTIDLAGDLAVLTHIRDMTDKQAIEQMRRDMVSMFSHDIKNPLGGILGAVDMLRDPEITPEQRAEYIDMIESSAHGAVTLAVNLVDSDRIERSELVLRRERKSLASIVRHAADHQFCTARVRGVDLILDLQEEKDFAMIDEPLFDRIVANLLSNAIKYTPSGKRVVIETRGEKDAVLRVLDQGPGIPEDKRDKLFERFSQPGERTTQSSGLGLFIVGTIAKAHGATIEVDCPPEGGTIFTVTLPLAPAP